MSCDTAGGLLIYLYIKKAITIIMVIAPILLLVLGTIDFMGAVTAGDEKGMRKSIQTFLKRMLICVVILLLPYIIGFIMSFASDITGVESKLLNCIDEATDERVAELEAKEEQERKTLLQKMKDALKTQEEEEKKEEKGWWWPVGSSETTVENGVTFASGAPVARSISARFAGNDKVHQGLGGGHGAIDIGAWKNSNVIASKSGVVIYPGPNDKVDYEDSFIKPDANGKYNCRGLKANNVFIQHDDGIVTVYSHLEKGTITVKAGDKVQQGQVIGKVGSSGCSTGYHLHFEMRINGSRVDPLKYVSNGYEGNGKNARP